MIISIRQVWVIETREGAYVHNDAHNPALQIGVYETEEIATRAPYFEDGCVARPAFLSLSLKGRARGHGQRGVVLAVDAECSDCGRPGVFGAPWGATTGKITELMERQGWEVEFPSMAPVAEPIALCPACAEGRVLRATQDCVEGKEVADVEGGGPR